jgi:hypothetical protein
VHGRRFRRAGLATEQPEVVADAGQVDRPTVRAEQRADVLDILLARRVVDEALQLEGDQALEADHPEVPEGRLARLGARQQLAGEGSVGVEEVHAFVAPLAGSNAPRSSWIWRPRREVGCMASSCHP